MCHREVRIVDDGRLANSPAPRGPLGLLLAFGSSGRGAFYFALKLKFTVAGFPSATVTFWV